MAKSAEGRLTTHVLDTATGKPASGLRIDFHDLNDGRTLVKTVHTNEDGRCDSPILAGDDFRTGRFELVFHVGAYLRAGGAAVPEPAFLDEVPIRFGMSEHAHYHVPLLVSPYGYSTYRGS
ncbi:MAG: hydroxyisourate hydrolase [Rhizobiaceae bacterium]